MGEKRINSLEMAKQEEEKFFNQQRSRPYGLYGKKLRNHCL